MVVAYKGAAMDHGVSANRLAIVSCPDDVSAIDAELHCLNSLHISA